MRISRCGVCHSDLHLHDGYFSLGGDKKLDVTRRAAPLPFTLGHEIAGVVEKAGPDADVKVGSARRGVPLDRLRRMRGLQGAARKTSARRRAISASRSTAASRPTCWCRIRAT